MAKNKPSGAASITPPAPHSPPPAMVDLPPPVITTTTAVQPVQAEAVHETPPPPAPVLMGLGDWYPTLQDPVATPAKPAAPATALPKQSIYDLVMDFHEAIVNHPDAKLLASDFESKPSQHIEFKDATREAQRVVMFRFLMRWPTKRR